MMMDSSQRYNSFTEDCIFVREPLMPEVEPEPSTGGLAAVLASVAALVRRR